MQVDILSKCPAEKLRYEACFMKWYESLMVKGLGLNSEAQVSNRVFGGVACYGLC